MLAIEIVGGEIVIIIICVSQILVYLSLNGANTSFGISEDSIALSIAAAGTETDTQPDGPCSSSEKENRGNNAKAETEGSLN